jgi:polynucleotide 5'-kinase involved in rRNA processing
MNFLKQTALKFSKHKKVFGVTTLLTTSFFTYQYVKKTNFFSIPSEVFCEETQKSKEVNNSIPNETEYSKKHDQSKLFRIVVTGGPFSGKSAVISAIANRLMSLGFLVFIIPEASALLTSGNGDIVQSMTPEQQIVYYGAAMVLFLF